jgi:hypothetical protein
MKEKAKPPQYHGKKYEEISEECFLSRDCVQRCGRF